MIIWGTFQSSAWAQNQQSDSSFLAQAVRYRRNINENKLADNARLYNGTDYREAILHDYDKGHPYFLQPGWKKGFIEYDGQWYENVDLLYDVVHDKVLTHQYYTLMKIELVQEKVSSFGIQDHVFIRVSANDSLGKVLQPGFYDRLVNGKASLYVKRKKEYAEDLATGQIVQEYTDKNAYFIDKDGKIFQVKSKKDLFKIFSEHKSVIKSRLAESKISFRKQFEATLISAVKLYNTPR